MTKQERYDNLYIGIAALVAEQSYSRRSKVGAILVKDGNTIGMGWNGMPAGMDNNCEVELPDGTLQTRPEVAHAEQNLLSKLARRGGIGADGGTLYITMSPCPECAKQIHGAGIVRVVYRDAYRLPDGTALLQRLGVKCEQLYQGTAYEVPC